MKDFEKWWRETGSGVLPKKDDDFESHTKNVCIKLYEWINNETK